MTKTLLLTLFIALGFTNFAGAQCLTDPVTDDFAPSGTDDLGNCIYALELTVTVPENSNVRLIQFSAGNAFQEVSAGGGNSTFPPGPVSVTLLVTVDCGNPSATATIEGFDNNGGGGSNGNGGGSCFSVTGEVIPGGPLPVELTSFRAELQNNDQVMIEWSTASEENNDYFELQHSTDGRNFEAMAKVQGNGTTDREQYYVYFDESPERGNNYYRIKQVDFDGQFEIFDVVVVKVKASENFKVFPAQTRDQVVFEMPYTAEENQTIDLYNSSGVLMRSAVLNSGDYTLNFDVQDFPAGVYYIRYINEFYDFETLKFVKVRD